MKSSERVKTNEKLVYQVNGRPAALAMLYFAFNTWQTIFTLNMIDMVAVGLGVMWIILLNTLLSFLVFIISFEMKRYSVPWSWAGLGIGAFQCLRVFIIPDGAAGTRMNIAISLVAGGVLLIIASIWSLVKCGKYWRARKELECRTLV